MKARKTRVLYGLFMQSKSNFLSATCSVLVVLARAMDFDKENETARYNQVQLSFNKNIIYSSLYRRSAPTVW